MHFLKCRRFLSVFQESANESTISVTSLCCCAYYLPSSDIRTYVLRTNCVFDVPWLVSKCRVSAGLFIDPGRFVNFDRKTCAFLAFLSVGKSSIFFTTLYYDQVVEYRQIVLVLNLTNRLTICQYVTDVVEIIPNTNLIYTGAITAMA